MSNNSVFHWGACCSMPVTLVAVSQNILAADIYFSKQPIPIRSKVEYTISTKTCKNVFLDKLNTISGCPFAKLQSVAATIKNLLTEFLDGVAEDILYITIPLAGTERTMMKGSETISQGLALIFKEKMFSSLLHTVVKQDGIINMLPASDLSRYIINLQDLKCEKHIIYDENSVNPCSLCKYNEKKIGDFCMYYTGSLECLFTVSLPPVSSENIDTVKLGAMMSGIPVEDFELVSTVTAAAAKDPNRESLDALIEQMALAEEEREEIIDEI